MVRGIMADLDIDYHGFHRGGEFRLGRAETQDE